MRRVDYDEIARAYDEPSRDHDVDPGLTAFLDGIPSLNASQVSVLDVGCGTGKQLLANRLAMPDATLVGADLSLGMLRVARERCPDAAWIQGDGEVLPFRGGTFHYVCNQFSYPHMRHQEGFIAEVLRVLRPSGRFVMTNIDPWSMTDWVLYRFFPAARTLDYRDFMTADDFSNAMRETGFVDVEVERARRSTREDLGAYLTYASARHRTSHFMAMSDEDYRAGVRRLERAVATARPGDTVPSEFCLLTIRGDKPR